METFNTQEITKLIRYRRSLYPAQYSEEVIKNEIVEEILENAIWAPTHKMTEPWHFTVFTGAGLKKLADFMASTYKQVTTANGTFNEGDHDKLATKPLLASAIQKNDCWKSRR